MKINKAGKGKMEREKKREKKKEKVSAACHHNNMIGNIGTIGNIESIGNWDLWEGKTLVPKQCRRSG